MNRRWAILFFLFVSFVSWGVRPLWEPDEGRYGESAREMAASGDWLVPRLEGREHLTKPPFTYWVTAAGLRLLGVNEWGARLFLSLAFFGTILCVAAIARAWDWSEQESLAAAMIFSTAVLPFASGHLLTTDMFLTFWETLGVLCAWKVWRGEARAPAWRMGFWLAFAMAFLTKGPPGWLPLGVIAVFAWIGRKSPKKAGMWSLPVFILFLAIAFSWFITLAIREPKLLSYFLKDEIYNRIFTTAHRRNHPWWIFPPILLAGYFPWIFLWPKIFALAWVRLRSGLKGLTAHELFSLLWVAIPLAVFTLGKSRLLLYVIPLCVPLSLWGGRVFVRYFAEKIRARRIWRRSAWVLGGLWLAGLLAFIHWPDSARFSRSNRAFALRLKARLAADSSVTSISILRGSVPHSIAFYVERPIVALDLSHRQARERLREPWQSPPGDIYMLSRGRFKSLRNEGLEYEILAEDDHYVAFRLPAASSRAESAPLDFVGARMSTF